MRDVRTGYKWQSRVRLIPNKVKSKQILPEYTIDDIVVNGKYKYGGMEYTISYVGKEKLLALNSRLIVKMYSYIEYHTYGGFGLNGLNEYGDIIRHKHEQVLSVKEFLQKMKNNRIVRNEKCEETTGEVQSGSE